MRTDFGIGSLAPGGDLPPGSDRHEPPEKGNNTQGSAATEFRTNRSLVRGVALSSSLNVGLAVMVPISIARLKLEGGLSAAQIGVCLAAVGVCSVVAAQVAGGVGGKSLAFPALLTASLVSLAGWSTSVFMISALMSFASATAIFFNVRWRTYRQLVTTPQRLGAVSSWCRSIAYSWIALVSFIGARFVSSGISASTVQTAAGVASLVCVIIVLAGFRSDRA